MWNQERLGSCTAHAVAAAFAVEVRKQGLPDFDPSRLFIWYNARSMLPDRKATLKNYGTYIRDAMKTLRSYGVCSEEEWPYHMATYWKFDEKTHFFLTPSAAWPARQPPSLMYYHALQHTILDYYSFKSSGDNLLHELINCLDQCYPFVLGMKTFGLLKTSTLHLQMPTAQDRRNSAHSHAVMVVGYNPGQKRFIVRNSWGADSNDRGYFTMPYDYALKYGSDFWTIRLVKA